MTGAEPEPPAAESGQSGPPSGESTPGGHSTPGGQSGPPGGGVFSLDERPTPALYLGAWVLSGLGVAIMFVAGLAQEGPRGLLLVAGLLLLTLGLAAAAGYQVVARRPRPHHAYRGPSPLIVFGIWFALVNLAALGLLVLGLQGLETVGPFLAGVAAQTIAYVAVIWLFVVRSGALDWRDMGLPAFSARRVLSDAAFSVGIMLPVTFAALVLGGIVAQLLDARPPTVVPTPDTTPELIAVLLAAAILAPIGEELFFRGFALRAWWRDLGPRSALVRSSIFFAVIHVANIQTATFEEGLRQAVVMLSVYLPLAFVLGWLYIRRGLIAPVLAHITYNAILVLLLVAATQLDP